MAETNDRSLPTEASYWWVYILQGIAGIIIGFMLLSKPIGTTLVLVQFLGLYWLLVGFIDVIVAIVDRKVEEHSGLKFVGGLIGILAGIFILNNALYAGIITPVILLYFVAFIFILNGLIRLFLGSKKEGGMYKWSWGSFFVGLFYVIFGLLLLAMPLGLSVASLVLATGYLLIIGGILEIVLSFKVKSGDVA